MPRDLFVAVDPGPDTSAGSGPLSCRAGGPERGGIDGVAPGGGGAPSTSSPSSLNGATRGMVKAKTMSARQFQRTVSPKPSRVGGGPGLEMGPLVRQLASADVAEAREAASAIRQGLKNAPGENKDRLVAAGGIEGLVALLASPDPACVEHSLASLLAISLTDGADALITQSHGLESIVRVLETGSASARETAAAAVFTLSSSSDAKERVRRAGGVPPLRGLLERGSLRGRKDACLALFNLTLDEACAREVVASGTPEVLLGLLATETDPGLEDKGVAVIANLCKYPEGRQAVVEYEGAIGTLLDIMDGGSSRSREDAVVSLFLLATHVPSSSREMAEEGATQALSKLAASGTPRAKSKAKALLELLRTNSSFSSEN